MVDRESQDTEHHRTLWGAAEYDDLEMERKMQPGDTNLREWRKRTLEGKAEEVRRTVTLHNSQGQPQVEWEFTDA
jgi:hypothetical protein